MFWLIIISITDVNTLTANDKPLDRNATFDPVTGWPIGDFGTVVAGESVDFCGTYVLYAKEASTNTLTAVINIIQNTTGLMLSFRNTSGSGLQDIVLLQSDHDLTSKSNITNLLLAHLSRFCLICFMDWISTNGNAETNWNQTKSINWPYYRVPLTNFTRIPQRYFPSDYTRSKTSHYIYRGWSNRRISSYDKNLTKYDVYTQTDGSFLELSSLQTCLAMHHSLLSMFTMNIALTIKLFLKLYPSVNHCLLI
ncbi:unnamed protein product [Rotaria sordida]|uniref:Uncharacterized protein n=1 Tax=Rotaria sordida TaxID=392033 RepID=A0A814SWP9_9BILA|nr:unnamed protein product [Rotaria sordida]CAF1242410.1 unnamed protein product [Rotaria sordida]CAF3716296.1 unnamed protein product [Rotaria sordida]